jgi:hypothetical protein
LSTHIINDTQIEFLINEFSKETNETIETIDDLIDANLIDLFYSIENSCKNLSIYL